MVTLRVTVSQELNLQEMMESDSELIGNSKTEGDTIWFMRLRRVGLDRWEGLWWESGQLCSSSPSSLRKNQSWVDRMVVGCWCRWAENSAPSACPPKVLCRDPQTWHSAGGGLKNQLYHTFPGAPFNGLFWKNSSKHCIINTSLFPSWRTFSVTASSACLKKRTFSCIIAALLSHLKSTVIPWQHHCLACNVLSAVPHVPDWTQLWEHACLTWRLQWLQWLSDSHLKSRNNCLGCLA